MPADELRNRYVDRIDLPYLGDRNYVHGSTIVDMLLAEFRPDFPLEIKFHAPIFGALRIETGATEKPNVAVLFGRNGQLVSLGLFDAGDGQLSNRLPFDEKSIERILDVGETSVSSLHDTNTTLISRVLVMNKVLMAKTFPGAAGKWWFAGLVANLWPQDAGSLTLEFDGGLGTKLARSTIAADGDMIGRIYFSLSRA